MFPNQFESDTSDYEGTLQTSVVEGPGPVYAPTNIIRSDESWHIKVEWEAHGPLAKWLDAVFNIRVFLESIGKGPEFDLPTVTVQTIDPAYPFVMGRRVYTKLIDIAAGDIPAGVYKVATVIHLFESASGNPTPFAGFVEGGMVYVFDPA